MVKIFRSAITFSPPHCTLFTLVPSTAHMHSQWLAVLPLAPAWANWGTAPGPAQPLANQNGYCNQQQAVQCQRGCQGVISAVQQVEPAPGLREQGSMLCAKPVLGACALAR